MTVSLAAPDTTFVRAKSGPGRAEAPRRRAQADLQQSDLQAVAQHMYALMLRNIATAGFHFTDPGDPSVVSRPGCIIAASSYPASLPGVDQDYIFNWTRDAAITAIELAAASLPTRPGEPDQTLVDYVTFAKTCQDNATPTLAHACYTIDGRSRPWTEQSDGPALQTLALLQAWPRLDAATREIAAQIIGTNLGFLLEVYQQPTTNLWEEHSGYSFFARAAQLRCLRAIAANTLGIAVPAGTDAAVSWLEGALQGHWDGTQYLSVLAPADTPTPVVEGYDPNIDIVLASNYGAVPVTDTKLLATAARLRQQWSDSGSPSVYPINLADSMLGLGPLLGRYPGDTYDGDVAEPVLGGHPWALCTCGLAELYYRLATEIAASRAVPYDDLAADFFGQVGVGAGSSPEQAVAALDAAADAMLQAVIYHSDNLELSEQFDGTSGYEKSVQDLTWSYAAFLSAVRAKTDRTVQG
jgi:glucoamylase